MKKILLVVMLFALISCNNNQTTTQKLSKEKIESNKNTNFNIDTGNQKNEDTQELLKLDEAKRIFSQYVENNTLLYKSQYDCNSYIDNLNLTNKDSQKIIDDFTAKCNKIKQYAIIEINKIEKDFTIGDCNNIKKIVNKKIKINDDIMPKLIESCEYNIAIKNGCELLKDETKIKKCEEYKQLKEKTDNLEMIKNFDLKSYL